MTPQLTTPDGTPISKFCFGTMQFGAKADEHASAQLYRACRETGINFFDTANVYAGGRSETILGNLVRPERNTLFIATKFGSANDASASVLQTEFDQSRRRLNLDVVDLLYIHQWNPNANLPELFEALAALVQAGSVRYLGVSNFAAWQVMKAQTIAKSFGVEVSVIQPMYNLVKRQAEVEILPMAQSEGIAICPYSPLGGGLLTGKYAAGNTGRLSSDKMYASRYSPKWMHDTAAALKDLADNMGLDPATLAVAWAARHPGVTAPIISARAVEQLRPSLTAMDFEMDDALYDRISHLSQSPAPATDRLEEA